LNKEYFISIFINLSKIIISNERFDCSLVKKLSTDGCFYNLLEKSICFLKKIKINDDEDIYLYLDFSLIYEMILKCTINSIST